MKGQNILKLKFIKKILFKEEGDERSKQKVTGYYKLDIKPSRVDYDDNFSCLLTSSYIDGLLKGGRWDLYQAIATADRFLTERIFPMLCISRFNRASRIAISGKALWSIWRSLSKVERV